MKTKTFKLFLLLTVFCVSLTSCSDEEESGADIEGSQIIDQSEKNGEVQTKEVIGQGKSLNSFTPYRVKDSSRAYNYPNIQRWPMVATGQKKCYDNYGEIQCPESDNPEYSSSGAVSYGLRAYTSNGDGTVKDGVTNLIWQAGYVRDKTWYEAKNYCDNLTLAGKRWRLPLTHELRSIVNYGVAAPSIDISAFPDTPSDWFWSSKHINYNTIDAGTETVASWIISFIDGSVEYTARDNYYSIRCVAVE